MKKRVLSAILTVVMSISLMAGCGSAATGTSSEAKTEEAAAESEGTVTESAEPVAESPAADVPSDESMAGMSGVEGNAFAEKVSTFMAEHGRPTGDLIVDLEAPKPEELTEEEGAEMDRAMRAYKPGIDSLLVNNAKSFYYYEQLDEDQQQIYDTILMLAEDPTDTNNIAAYTMKEEPDDAFYTDCIAPAYFAVMYDHPELFWLYGGEDNYLAIGNTVMNGENILYLGYSEPYKNYEKDMKAFNEAAKEFLKDIDLTASDAQKADAIHDKLIDMVTYDDAVAKNQVRNDLAHTAYGALVANSRGDANTCVCDGYSLAYVYLCQQAGLEAAFLCGMAGNDKLSAGGHAWSIVKIDGQWKEVDSCWDDWDDLFEAMKAEFGSQSDADSQKIMQAISDEEFQKALMHYLDCVSTDYITNFKDAEAFMYVYGDGTALVLINESVHIRMDSVSGGGADSVLMKMAPIAK